MRIDFVSDVACPWCAVGLHSLEQALSRVGDEIAVDLRFEPFELNPQMPAEGEDAARYLMAKYGLGAERLKESRAHLRERGAAVGFAFGERPWVWNTFDAHRMLHWAGTVDRAKQRALKHALLDAYHGRAENPGARDVLLRAADIAGLDIDRAAAVFDSGEHADAVRERERYWQRRGIRAVPAVVIDDAHLISGGQPPDVFEQALRRINDRRETAPTAV